MTPKSSFAKRYQRHALAAALILFFQLSLWNTLRFPLVLPLSDYQKSLGTQPKILERGELMHLVKTRFMQHQAHLAHLTKARLELFKTFCLPSMIKQTDQDFFWLISVDPSIDQAVLTELVGLLRPYPNFYITLTTDNLRPGSALHGIGEEIITGDVKVLRTNLGNWNKLAILESQLDADDALHVRYVEELQKEAIDVFFDQEDGPDWMYWCIHQDIEWHWIHQSYSLGALKPSKSFIQKQKCYTPGMSLGVRRGKVKGVLEVPHSQLISELERSRTKCGKHHRGLDCVSFLDSLEFPALRTRTPTSASMVGVNVKQSSSESDQTTSNEYLERPWTDFGVQMEDIRNVNQHLSENMALIIKDAIQGQCSHGHSCREAAKESLDAFARVYGDS